MTPPHCPRNFSTLPQRLSSDSLKQFQGPRRPPALHPQITAPKAVPTFPQLDKGTWGPSHSNESVEKRSFWSHGSLQTWPQMLPVQAQGWLPTPCSAGTGGKRP